MKTLRLRAAPHSPDCADLHRAAAILREGGTVAFATETVYGLGADALNPEAVAKIFAAKQRPAWDPLIVHIGDQQMLPRVATSVPPAAREWIPRFWPGPLTLLMPRAAALAPAITAGRTAVAVRIPAHPVALALLRAALVPIAAPSANIFGHVSPTTADHVAADLDGRIDAILDSGPTTHGVESTVVDASADPCILYRPGAVTLDELRAVWPHVEPFSDTQLPPREQSPTALPAPGLGMRHYAPRARLILVEQQGPASLADSIQHAVDQAQASGLSVGLMLPLGIFSDAQAVASYPWGVWDEPATLAQSLYAGLRELDAAAVQAIVCPLPPPVGIGLAIIDRLRKAARAS